MVHVRDDGDIAYRLAHQCGFPLRESGRLDGHAGVGSECILPHYAADSILSVRAVCGFFLRHER